VESKKNRENWMKNSVVMSFPFFFNFKFEVERNHQVNLSYIFSGGLRPPSPPDQVKLLFI